MNANPHQVEMFGADPTPRQQAARRRDDGIARALDHAEKARRQWKQRALEALGAFLRERELPFLAETFRAFATATKGVEEPPDARAWGAVMQAGKRAGMIVSCGAERALTSNLSFKVLWKRKKEG
jgi:hypothetical protein